MCWLALSVNDPENELPFKGIGADELLSWLSCTVEPSEQVSLASTEMLLTDAPLDPTTTLIGRPCDVVPMYVPALGGWAALELELLLEPQATKANEASPPSSAISGRRTRGIVSSTPTTSMLTPAFT